MSSTNQTNQVFEKGTKVLYTSKRGRTDIYVVLWSGKTRYGKWMAKLSKGLRDDDGFWVPLEKLEAVPEREDVPMKFQLNFDDDTRLPDLVDVKNADELCQYLAGCNFDVETPICVNDMVIATIMPTPGWDPDGYDFRWVDYPENMEEENNGVYDTDAYRDVIPTLRRFFDPEGVRPWESKRPFPVSDIFYEAYLQVL